MGYDLVSGGTDTHLILIDLSNKDVSGKAAEKALGLAEITVNKNMVPFDKRKPFVTSGIRIGTPAITTRGMKPAQMVVVAKLIDKVISNHKDEDHLAKVADEVRELTKSFPLYPKPLEY